MKTSGLKELKYKDIKIGDEASFDAVITEEDVKSFMKISGDINPLHSDEKYALSTKIGGKIVHGMLVSSLFSTLVGTHLPGKYCLYLSQELQFKNFVKPNTQLMIQGRVINKMDALKLITIDTKISDKISNKIYVSGKARVQLLQ
ncbi:MAG: MaoC family dehydratase [Patescibacteria group bacterium]